MIPVQIQHGERRTDVHLVIECPGGKQLLIPPGGSIDLALLVSDSNEGIHYLWAVAAENIGDVGSFDDEIPLIDPEKPAEPLSDEGGPAMTIETPLVRGTGTSGGAESSGSP